MTMGKGWRWQDHAGCRHRLGLSALDIGSPSPRRILRAHVSRSHRNGEDHLMVSRIDPVMETKAMPRKFWPLAGATLDEQGRALLTEDLRSPCTEEMPFRALPVVARAQTVLSSLTQPYGPHPAPARCGRGIPSPGIAHHVRRAQEVKELLPRLRTDFHTGASGYTPGGDPGP